MNNDAGDEKDGDDEGGKDGDDKDDKADIDYNGKNDHVGENGGKRLFEGKDSQLSYFGE